MQSSVERVLGIYELTERIIRQLDCPVEIIRAQHVCRNWRDIIQTSPVLHEACWYRSRPRHHKRDAREHTQPAPVSAGPGPQTWKLNPAFNRIGVSVQLPPGEVQECGEFKLTERIYDTPGSWTTMLATQPPCQRIEITCYDPYTGDGVMYYLIESMTGYLLMGDVMAVLAECQNRQACGVDRWAGVLHYTGQLIPWTEEAAWIDTDWPKDLLEKMPDDVSLKVVVEQAWGSGAFPAFSLRRIYPSDDDDEDDDDELDDDGQHPAGAMRFLHEMIVHRMIAWDGREYYEYQWEWWNHGGKHGKPVCEIGEYKANLVVVKEHQEGYLAECSHIFRLLSDIKKI